MLIISMLINGVFGLLSSFSQSFAVFLLLRIFSGVGCVQICLMFNTKPLIHFVLILSYLFQSIPMLSATIGPE